MKKILLLILLASPVNGVVTHSLTENGDTTALFTLDGIPTHAISDFCDGAGWFDQTTCTRTAVRAGLCTTIGDLLDPDPNRDNEPGYRTQICTAGFVASGRCRAAQQDELIPRMVDCGAWFPYFIRRVSKGLVLKGVQNTKDRIAIPNTSDPFEAD